MTSKCGKNKKVAHEAQLSDSLMFLPQFDVFWDLLQCRPVLTWEILFYTTKRHNDVNADIYASVLQ